MDNVKRDFIYRIDGNLCFKEPIRGILGYFKTKESAENFLKEKNYYLETRFFDTSKNDYWYNKKLSDDGYSYDDTHYAFITKIELKS